MKAMNPEFQTILDEGEALKGQLISALNKDNKSSFKVSLRAWLNSVINQTQGISYYGTESLDNIIEHAEFYLESLTPKEVTNQIDRVIEIIASIPPTRARVSSVQTQAHDTAGEYQRLKLALERKALYLAKLISGITFLIPAIVIIAGAIGLILGHPFPGGLIGGIAIIAFVLMELLGNMQHIARWRSKLESLILPGLRRALGAEESSKFLLPSVLGLDSTVRDKQKDV